MDIILKGKTVKTRILRPKEYELLRKGAGDIDKQTNLDACLLLGARYSECVFIQNHPEFINGRYIYITEKKKKRTDTDRYIKLSNLGLFTMPHFFKNKLRLTEFPQGYRNNMIRYAEKVNLDPTGLSPRSLRKTLESWLMACYPERSAEIYLSQGHTEIVSLKHYMGLPFTDEDKKDMKYWTDGW